VLRVQIYVGWIPIKLINVAEGMPNGSAGQEHLETQVVVVMITMQVVVVVVMEVLEIRGRGWQGAGGSINPLTGGGRPGFTS
jgi:hypothetical protein